MARVLAKYPINPRRLQSFSFVSTQYRFQSGAPAEGPGYFVLLPEVPPETPETARLLDFQATPPFDLITKEGCRNAIAKTALELESTVWRVEEHLSDPSKGKSYDAIVKPIEEASAPFEYSWSIAKTLNVVKNELIPSEGYMSVHDRAINARSKKFQSLALYHAFKEIKTDNKDLEEPQQRIVEKYLLEGKLSGVDLTGKQKTHFLEASKKLQENKTKFRKNVEAMTKRFRHLLIDPKYIGDMPTHMLINLSKDKSQPTKGPWLITLTNPVYKNFLEYCPERALRWNTWVAYNSRASGHNDKDYSNSVNIENIRMQRRDQAQLLGFENYVELSMLTKMAGDVFNVNAMIATLYTHAKPKQQEEIEELKDFAASRGFDSKLQPWDIDYYRRKHRQSLYNVDAQERSEYFPFPHVWKQLCSFAEELFNIRITQVKVPVWQEDVSYFEVSDAANGRKYGGFYLDPYVRPGDKLGHGSWVLNMRNRQDSVGMKPLSTLIFNFAPPLYGKPCFLSFQELYPLFEKFGTMLQQVLTEMPYGDIAGTNNIEWDAVGVSAKFMSMWLGNKEMIKRISSHYESGDPMPDTLMKGLLRSHKHMAGFDLSHELYLSALDLELHSKKEFWMDIVKQTWTMYKQPLNLDKKDAHPCSLLPIFSGDYAAAYYTNLWSHMLAADLYYSFVEDPSASAEERKLNGQRFRSSFLAMGGGYHPSKIFRQFRGRDPCPDAFLWSLGLADKPDLAKIARKAKERLKADEEALKKSVS